MPTTTLGTGTRCWLDRFLPPEPPTACSTLLGPPLRAAPTASPTTKVSSASSPTSRRRISSWDCNTGRSQPSPEEQSITTAWDGTHQATTRPMPSFGSRSSGPGACWKADRHRCEDMPGLSYEQGAGIVSRLKKNRKYSLFVTCEGEDSDALSYANDLTQALREGGWEVSGP